ncbi:MAG: hypothetical protein Q4G00_08910 [Clostridia bacterium]|nr:hypothetical protein [Clostridia bacterium]
MARLFEVLALEMGAMGFLSDERDVFHIAPDLVALTPGCWSRLAEGDESPFVAVEAAIPELSELWLEALCKRLEEREAVKQALREDPDASVNDFVNARVVLEASPEAWLAAPVRMNLGLTVDGDWEYTLNVVYPANQGEAYEAENKGCFDRSSIMWLTRRQGYTQAQLNEARHRVEEASRHKDPRKVIPSEYLFSAANEIWNELSVFNQLGFFALMPLREALLMAAMQRWGRENGKWPGYVLLDKSVRCGFFSTFNGSCSRLGIKLEKPVKLPLDIAEAEPDMDRGSLFFGFSLYSVCKNPGLWQPGKILHWGLPRQFRRDAAALGVGQLPPRGPYKSESAGR